MTLSRKTAVNYIFSCNWMEKNLGTVYTVSTSKGSITLPDGKVCLRRYIHKSIESIFQEWIDGVKGASMFCFIPLSPNMRDNNRTWENKVLIDYLEFLEYLLCIFELTLVCASPGGLEWGYMRSHNLQIHIWIYNWADWYASYDI